VIHSFYRDLYFAGDFIRLDDFTSSAVAKYDFDDDDYLAVSQGITTLSKTLPTLDEAISPTLLFSNWTTNLLLIAGHFDSRYNVNHFCP
jgi:hypothetical protein